MKTIFMSKADWQKWDTALRSGEYRQVSDALHDPMTGGYCCLGVLQQCLTGSVESEDQNQVGNTENDDGDPEDFDNLPSFGWLTDHHVRFLDSTGSIMRQPFLAKLGMQAAVANDRVVCSSDDGSCDRVYDFTKIADAIADAVEFTD